MNEPNQTNETTENTRRRFLKGAAATPVIMTVASRPVMGAYCTPSAWVSGNLSDNGPKVDSCGGRSPGFWKARPDKWSRTGYLPGTCKNWSYKSTCKVYKDDGTKFNAVFVSGNPHYDNKTLMQVLWLEGYEDPYQLGAHIVAAVLNAASKPNYGMSVADVQKIYSQLAMTGVYQPSVGDPMTAQDIVKFIQNTFY